MGNGHLSSYFWTLVQLFLDIYPAGFLSSYFWINVLNRIKIQKWQDDCPEIAGLQYPVKNFVILDKCPGISG